VEIASQVFSQLDPVPRQLLERSLLLHAGARERPYGAPLIPLHEHEVLLERLVYLGERGLDVARTAVQKQQHRTPGVRAADGDPLVYTADALVARLGDRERRRTCRFNGSSESDEKRRR